MSHHPCVPPFRSMGELRTFAMMLFDKYASCTQRKDGKRDDDDDDKTKEVEDALHSNISSSGHSPQEEEGHSAQGLIDPWHYSLIISILFGITPERHHVERAFRGKPQKMVGGHDDSETCEDNGDGDCRPLLRSLRMSRSAFLALLPSTAELYSIGVEPSWVLWDALDPKGRGYLTVASWAHQLRHAQKVFSSHPVVSDEEISMIGRGFEALDDDGDDRIIGSDVRKILLLLKQ